MSESGVNSSSSSFLVVASLYIHCIAIDDDFTFCFYLVFIFLCYVFHLCFVSVLAGVALLSAVLFFVLCGSGGAIDMITDMFLAQSFLTSLLWVGVWIIISLICSRDSSWFCRTRRPEAPPSWIRFRTLG